MRCLFLLLAIFACGGTQHCSGALPQFCTMCSDGSEQCAHFNDKCEIVTCE